MSKSPKYCIHCGGALQAAEKFCMGCGKPIPSEASAPPPAAAKEAPPPAPSPPPAAPVKPTVPASPPLLPAKPASPPVASPPADGPRPDRRSFLSRHKKLLLGLVIVAGLAILAGVGVALVLHTPDIALTDLQKIRFRMIQQFSAQKLPLGFKVYTREGDLEVHFDAQAASEGHLETKKAALPVVILAGEAAAANKVGFSRIIVKILQSGENTLVIETPAALLADYLNKRITPQDFHDRVQARIVLWEPSGKNDRERADACLDHGAALCKKNLWSQALPFFQRAFKLAPDNIQVNQNLGVCLFSLGEHGQAIPHLKKASDAKPKDAVIADFLAQCHQLTGDYKKAADFAGWALGIDGMEQSTRASLLYIKAYSLFQLDRYAEAEPVAREVIAVNPRSNPAWLLARILICREKYAEAVTWAQKATELDSKDAENFYTLALACQGTKNWRGAIQAFRKAGGMIEKPSENLYVKLSYCYVQAGDIANCRATAAEGLKLYPDSESLKKNYKVAYEAQIKGR